MTYALASLLLATVIGLLLRARDGRFRSTTARQDSPLATWAEGTRATFVQFSAESCSVCPRSLEVLRSVAAATPGVEVAELRAEEHMDLVRLLDVRRSPTVFLLDAEGTVRTRSSGAMNRELARAALAELDERTDHVHA
ncbi:TlpA family protein disulfide reductase [Actinotalea sp.]|uniref:TlpA family protein disulfide reductase n=1 Tax=Actinotalea sp. TaxID=1872145 RepID=UPI003565F18E